MKRNSQKQHWEDFWASKKQVGEIYSNADRVLSHLQNAVNLSGKKIMEVGAGTGRDGLRLVDLGATVFLLDYSDRSLAMMKEIIAQEKKRVFLIKADAEALPIKENALDVVFHQGLLEHFRDPMPLLKENYRVLERGGVCLIDVPQRYHIYTVIKHILILVNAWFAGWETEFSARKLGKLVRGVGFKVRSFYGDWMRPSLLYRVLREVLKRIGIRLPMYPKGIPAFGRLRVRIRTWIKKYRWSWYTCLDLGVISEKPHEERV